MPGLQTLATEADIKSAERDMLNELMQRAKKQLKGVSASNEVHVRDILPSEDLESGADNGWNGTDREWIQSGLTAHTEQEVYNIDSTAGAEDKVIGFYAVSSIATDILTNEIILEDGTGSRFERLMFEEAQTFTDGEYALLQNPIIFNEGKDSNIYVYTGVDGDEQLVLHGAVAEKAGTTLGTRSQTEDAPAGVARRPNGR